jgi:hypothetical protein
VLARVTPSRACGKAQCGVTHRLTASVGIAQNHAPQVYAAGSVQRAIADSDDRDTRRRGA